MSKIDSYHSRPPTPSSRQCGTTRQWIHLFLIAALLLGALTPAFAQVRPCVTISCPADLTAECTSPDGAVVQFAVRASSLCSEIASVVSTPRSGSTFPPGTTTVRTIAKDARGNIAECSFQVTVRDSTPPAIRPPGTVIARCAGTNGAPVRFVVDASDACSPVVLECTPPSGSLFAIGTNTVTCVARDRSGNKSSETFKVIVTDECPACVQLDCPKEPIVLEADSAGIAIATFDVQAHSLCGATPWIRCDPPSGSNFPVGTNQVLCTAGTGADVLQRCLFQVIVHDSIPPHISARGRFLLRCQGIFNGFPGALATYPGVRVHDNADPAPQVTFDPAPGTALKLGVHEITCVARDASGNATTNHFGITVISGPACEVEASNAPIAPPDNWDFEYGLKDWTRTGNAFDSQPTLGDNVHVQRVAELRDQAAEFIGGDYWKDLEFPIGHHGDHWIGTAENHPDDSTPPGTMQGNEKVGRLTSEAFVLEQPFITFLIGGDQDSEKLRVELLVKSDPGTAGAFQIGTTWWVIAKHTFALGVERMRRETFNAGDYVGKFCRLRIVDDSTTGHLNVDDFRFQPQHPFLTEVKVGDLTTTSVVFHEQHLYDWDSPVWGLADLHTHPMSHLALGKRVFHGQPDGPIESALSDCNCDHGGPGLDNGCGNYLREMVMAAFDGESPASPHQRGWDGNPWKRFQRWPVFTSYSHQQMWHEWIRRAYDGGLRVMVALTVHSKLLAGAMLESEPPFDDRSVMLKQIEELKAFVGRHADFMEIAYSPLDLRRIVRNNKLAIIIGSETDQIGNFNNNPAVREDADAVSKEIVRAELQKLYDAGLRYIFPVHLTDNKFGGSAIYSPLFTISTKYYMGRPVEVEGVNNGIHYKLPNLDLTSHLPSGDEIAGVLFEALGNPFAPFQMMIETQGAAMGSTAGVSDSTIGLAGIGAAVVFPVVISSPVAVPLLPVIADAIDDFSKLDIPSDILPIGGNYPDYSKIGKGMTGHRNVRGLTKLGRFAIREMMRMGMIIDIDHMAEIGVDETLAMAEAVRGGYPLNSGHNSFRALRYDASENHRTAEQLERIRSLGGIMGLGWGNGDFRWASDGLGAPPKLSSSRVDNTSPGTSRTFAQTAIYGLEKMQRRQIALGSDINGFVVGPGPRFGPQGAFGTREDNVAKRSEYISKQENGIAYTPVEGRPNTTGVFDSRGVDKDKDDQDARTWLGYRYNKQQRDFFVALRIFRWGRQKSPKLTHDDVPLITGNLHDTYDRDRVKEFVRGLLLGPTNGEAGSDIDPDVNMKQKLAKAVYRRKVFGEAPPDEIFNDETRYRRYKHFIKVWEDYEKIYGANTPMKRCETQSVQWDFNFDGLTHYGMLPDFFQDLNNVGLEPQDMSPMFQSSEDFARMWTRCLEGAWHINHPFLRIQFGGRIGDHVVIGWDGDEADQIEESENPGDPKSWHPVDASISVEDVRRVAQVRGDDSPRPRFFRVRKP